MATLFNAFRFADITDLCLRLGIPGKRQNAERGLFKCPFCSATNPHMFTYAHGRKRNNTFYCFYCKKYGDGVNLASQVLGLKPVEAAMWICREFNILYDDEPRATDQERRELLVPAPEVQLVAALVNAWRKMRFNYWRDQHEQLTEQVEIIASDPKLSSTSQMDTVLQAAVHAAEEMDRWRCMDLPGLFEEIKAEIVAYENAAPLSRKVPFCGEVR